MYRRKAEGFWGYIDFILVDILCLQVAFVLAYRFRNLLWNPYGVSSYRYIGIFLILCDILVLLLGGSLRKITKRGYYKEFLCTVRQGVLIGVITVLFLFISKTSSDYSRVILFSTILVYIVLNYIGRVFLKKVVRNRLFKSRKKVFVIVSESLCDEYLKDISKNTGSEIFGKLVLKEDLIFKIEKVVDVICKGAVEEVYIKATESDMIKFKLDSAVSNISNTGVPVHIVLVDFNKSVGKRFVIEKDDDYVYLTSSINQRTIFESIFKRALDIVGGIVGCAITVVLIVVLGPIIYINSPGPIFFSQVRVGKNGKKFKMYKFRSMYLDAEKKKKELEENNRVKDGMMFKLDFDTRIIGNKLLEDGTKKTGFGDFLRRSSLDEFPQFFNVLKGDMSLVGTRPPTVDEWEKYKPSHYARLAIKPGITGMWQVSGRSSITDFEEVVKLDLKYINNWSIGLDIKILFKTVSAVLSKDGSM